VGVAAVEAQTLDVLVDTGQGPVGRLADFPRRPVRRRQPAVGLGGVGSQVLRQAPDALDEA
jgi:hypothetical protein